jgi:hypothetical protein
MEINTRSRRFITERNGSIAAKVGVRTLRLVLGSDKVHLGVDYDVIIDLLQTLVH